MIKMKKKSFHSTLFFGAFSKFSLENNFVLIPVIAVMIIIISPSSVFAVEVVLPPQAAPEDFPGQGPPEDLPEQVPPDVGRRNEIRIIEHGNLRAEMRLLYTTVDSPANHVVAAGGTLDGVGDVRITTATCNENTGQFGCFFRCSGSLLLSGKHVLLAAHCITDGSGVIDAQTATVTFETASGDEEIAVTTFDKHPDWNGNSSIGNDIALLTLATEASASIDRFDIDRVASDDVGAKVKKTGYGRSGTGLTGDTLASGTKRTGFNIYDQTHDEMMTALNVGFVSGAVLQYDFDNGTVPIDAFDFFFNNPQLGVSPLTDEVMSAGGDSGGPSTSSPIITGVTSYGIRLSFMSGPPPRTSDIDNDLNSSWGEFAGDTRVSSYAAFIDSIAPAFCGKFESDFNRIDGTAGNNIIGGTNGPDLIFGGAGDDHIQGLGGDDCIFGEGGNDTISGGPGNDEISGGDGADHITGRAGNDTLFGDAGDDIISGGADNDTIEGGLGNDQITGRDGNDTISGNDGNDLISGGPGADIINGNAGDDKIAGREGIDTIDGGPDTDLCQDQADTISNCEL